MPRSLHYVSLLTFVVALLAAPSAPARAASQPGLPPSPFGINAYITGAERSEAQARGLTDMARRAGAAWSREEISWAAWGDRPASDFYDRRIRMLADAGLGVIGMLLTTPEKYRDKSCVRYAEANGHPPYWCAPNSVDAYARWVRWAVERFDGDGNNDAPGSPRVAAWEIWNEPDQDGTWLPKADPAAYAALLRAGRDAVKQSDPTALVLNGGVMTFDAVGVNGFMEQVVQIAGWDSFDVLSLHPWLIDHAPDDPRLINARERFDVTIPGRLAMAKRWVDSHGGGKPIWISEVGWSVCGASCDPSFAKSEEQQADYLVRTFVLSIAAGVEHVSFFQLEDKFDGAQQPWGPAAIIRDDGSPRPAYAAYSTMVHQLQFARYAGAGPLHRPGQLADYRFALADGGSVDVLWSLRGAQGAELPLNPGQSASLLSRDGAISALPRAATARLTVGEHPVYVRQSAGGERLFPETGQALRGRFLSYWQANGGLSILGLPLGPEQTGADPQGRPISVQYLERARLEYHPQTGDQVLLGLLGVETLARRGVDWRALPGVEGAGPGCRYFPETRHSLCPPFRAYWERNGGLRVFGLPISEPAPEVSADDGQTYTVQYFERNRFEAHATGVLLGRLGAELMPR
jgi:hypothetical protein